MKLHGNRRTCRTRRAHIPAKNTCFGAARARLHSAAHVTRRARASLPLDPDPCRRRRAGIGGMDRHRFGAARLASPRRNVSPERRSLGSVHPLRPHGCPDPDRAHSWRLHADPRGGALRAVCRRAHCGGGNAGRIERRVLHREPGGAAAPEAVDRQGERGAGSETRGRQALDRARSALPAPVHSRGRDLLRGGHDRDPPAALRACRVARPCTQG